MQHKYTVEFVSEAQTLESDEGFYVGPFSRFGRTIITFDWSRLCMSVAVHLQTNCCNQDLRRSKFAQVLRLIRSNQRQDMDLEPKVALQFHEPPVGLYG